MYAQFIKRIMNNRFNTSALLVSLCLLTSAALSTTAQAAKKDLEQEITIKSQRQAADLKNKIASYLDDVKISQGSISITADIVQVFSDKDDKSAKKADIYIAKGKPAVFQQQLEDGSLISLQADEIKYQPELNTITVSGNALVKQAGSEVSGSKITYNTLSEKLEAESNNNETVTTILQPNVIKKQQAKKEKQDKEGDNSDKQ